MLQYLRDHQRNRQCSINASCLRGSVSPTGADSRLDQRTERAVYVADLAKVNAWATEAADHQQRRYANTQPDSDEIKYLNRTISFAHDWGDGPVNEAFVREAELKRDALLRAGGASVESYSSGELASRLGISVQAVRNRAKHRKIPGVIRTGRSFQFEKAKADKYCQDLSHGNKQAPSRRVSNVVERLQRNTKELCDLSAKFGVDGFRPQLRDIVAALAVTAASSPGTGGATR